MKMQGKKRVRLKIPSNYIFINPIRAFVKQLAHQLKFPQMRVDDIESTMEELCNNAIEHGSCEAKSSIFLVMTLNEKCLEILVRDEGKCKGVVNWLQSGRLEEIEKKISPEDERGHGLFLVKTLSDRMDIKSNTYGGTDVRVVFLRKSSKGK